MRDEHYPSIPIEDALYEAPFIHLAEKPHTPSENTFEEWTILQQTVYTQEMIARGQTYQL